MNKFTKITAILCCAATAATLAACDGLTPSGPNNPNNPNKPSDPTPPTPSTNVKLDFTDNSNSNNAQFNNDLYYRNDLTLDMGDPMLVYDDGVFYAVGTRSGVKFQIFSSTNLADWTEMTNAGFAPRASSWGTTSLWAPDIQKIGNKWYMYYTANYRNSPTEDHCQLGVAVADTPYGPYTQWTGTNALGQTIGIGDLPFQGMEHNTILDSHVFQDDDGELYMYFSYDTKFDKDPERNNGTAELYGVHLLDPVTWDLSTLTRLVSAGYKNLDGSKGDIPWETWSPSFDEPMECVEGPYMIKHNGKYILTYCANSFVDTEYAVGYAVSDTPLGAYEKPTGEYLENMICGVPGQLGTYINTRYLGFMTGTGHASVCKVGDEYMLAYHAHYNRDKWGALSEIYGEKSEWRALGVDYIYFDDDGMPYCNGPTYSLQRLPEAVTGYRNIALDATVAIDGKTDGAALLNDNFTNRAFNTEEVNREAQFTAGTHTITLTFEQDVTIKAVNIYNTYDYNKRTDTVDMIEFAGVGYCADIKFNQSYVVDSPSFIYPHSAYNVELKNEATTKSVTITISCDHDFALGEIEILGK